MIFGSISTIFVSNISKSWQQLKPNRHTNLLCTRLVCRSKLKALQELVLNQKMIGNFILLFIKFLRFNGPLVYGYSESIILAVKYATLFNLKSSFRTLYCPVGLECVLVLRTPSCKGLDIIISEFTLAALMTGERRKEKLFRQILSSITTTEKRDHFTIATHFYD